MSDKEESKHTAKDEESAGEEKREEERDEEEDDEEDEEESRSDQSKRAVASARGAGSGADSPTGRLAIIAVAALAVGLAGGWYGQKARQAAEIRKESMPSGSGSAVVSGPCGQWQQKLCESSGEHSATCEQAKSATDLLTTPTCELALQSIPATLAKIKAARAPCDTLMTKLCADLPPGSQTCQMVKDTTPRFPPSRCDQMLKNYSQVIAQLKMRDQQGPGPGMQGGPGMHMMGHPQIQVGPTMQGAPVGQGPGTSPAQNSSQNTSHP